MKDPKRPVNECRCELCQAFNEYIDHVEQQLKEKEAETASLYNLLDIIDRQMGRWITELEEEPVVRFPAGGSHSEQEHPPPIDEVD